MASPLPRRWPDKAMVWRWHFFAGLFCVPFVLCLSLTGSIYLFRPQIEALLDRPYAAVATGGSRGSAAAQAAAAVRAVPGAVLHRYQLPDTSTQAVQVIVGRGVRETRVYVHPQTLEVLKLVDEDARPMRLVSSLHGELLAGPVGSYVVELAASWAIVMIVTGLVLWWPAGRGPAGVVYPRLSAGGRRFWRDLHAVTGLWVSFAALFLLLSGLPWATSWGGYVKTIRSIVERQAPRQDWSTGRVQETKARAAADAGTRAMLDEHAEHHGMTMQHPATSYLPLDRLIATVRPLALAPPVLIAPPTGPDASWTAKSDAADRPLRSDLTLDGATGAVLTRTDFADRQTVDRIVGYGIAVHEGQLFGWLNQLVNLLTALGLALLAVSSIVLWWRRRPDGKLGAPTGRYDRKLAGGFGILLFAMALLLPLFGLSLLIVLGLDVILRHQAPRLAQWLGMRRRGVG